MRLSYNGYIGLWLIGTILAFFAIYYTGWTNMTDIDSTETPGSYYLRIGLFRVCVSFRAEDEVKMDWGCFQLRPLDSSMLKVRHTSAVAVLTGFLFFFSGVLAVISLPEMRFRKISAFGYFLTVVFTIASITNWKEVENDPLTRDSTGEINFGPSVWILLVAGVGISVILCFFTYFYRDSRIWAEPVENSEEGKLNTVKIQLQRAKTKATGFHGKYMEFCARPRVVQVLFFFGIFMALQDCYSDVALVVIVAPALATSSIKVPLEVSDALFDQSLNAKTLVAYKSGKDFDYYYNALFGSMAAVDTRTNILYIDNLEKNLDSSSLEWTLYLDVVEKGAAIVLIILIIMKELIGLMFVFSYRSKPGDEDRVDLLMMATDSFIPLLFYLYYLIWDQDYRDKQREGKLKPIKQKHMYTWHILTIAENFDSLILTGVTVDTTLPLRTSLTTIFYLYSIILSCYSIIETFIQLTDHPEPETIDNPVEMNQVQNAEADAFKNPEAASHLDIEETKGIDVVRIHSQ